MRGGQLALESWAIRTIEASPSGVSVVELSGPMGPTVPPGREATQKPVPKNGIGFLVIGREPKTTDCWMLF